MVCAGNANVGDEVRAGGGEGIAGGAGNALVIVGLKVNSFIATLATSSILAAMIQWISGGQQTRDPTQLSAS